MGLIARGAQKIVSTITVRDYDGTPSNKQLECEFYPNGLMKSYVADHSQKFYMYDKKHNEVLKEKARVKAIMKDRSGRDKRKARGEMTQFDQMAADAVSSARQELRVPGMDAETRKNVVDKICESLEKTLPWEVLGDTYMGRRQFYQLRAEFVCLVAKHLGMTDPEERRIISPR